MPAFKLPQVPRQCEMLDAIDRDLMMADMSFANLTHFIRQREQEKQNEENIKKANQILENIQSRRRTGSLSRRTEEAPRQNVSALSKSIVSINIGEAQTGAEPPLALQE